MFIDMEHVMDFRFIALWVGVPLLVLCIVVSTLLIGRRSRGAQRPGLTRGDQVGAAVIGTGALLVGGLNAWGLIAGAIEIANTQPRTIRGMPIGNAGVPEFTAKSDAIVGAGYESVWLEVADVPLGARWWLYLEGALPSLATLAISVSVVWLSVALLRGSPFTEALTNGIGVSAIAVLIGGLGAQIAGAASREAIAWFLDPRVITAGDSGSGPYEGLVGVLNLDLSPVGWAFGLALVAAAFHIGTRMQRETELLV